MKCILLGISCVLAWTNTVIAQPPMLKGEVKRLNGAPVTNTPIRLLEPDINGATDRDGIFKIQLSAKWKVGDQVTLRVQLKGYEVLRPWEGKITIQAEADKKIESVILAKDTLVRLLGNPAELERLIVLLARSHTSKTTGQADADKKLSPSISIKDSLFSLLDNPAELERLILLPAITEREFSLEQVAKRLNVSLSELVDLLNEWKKRAEARGTVYEKALAALYEKNYGDAIKLLSQDISVDEREIARFDSLRNLLPSKYVNLGLAHANKYEYAEAEQAYKKALALNPYYLEARILLGNIYKFSGRLVEALNLYWIEAYRLRGKLDSKQRELYASLLLEIGNINETQGNLDSALVHYRQALAINRSIKYFEGVASGLSNIADIYATQGKLDSALVYYRQALAINRRLQHTEGIVIQLTNIGNVYQTQGQLDSALIYYQQTLAIYKNQLKTLQGQAIILGNIGVLFKTQGQLDSALVYYRQALTINCRLQNSEGMASDLSNIGNVYQVQKHLDSALVYHQQALVINRRLQRLEGIANQLGNIGNVYQTLEQLDSALVYYRQALAINRHLQRPLGIGIQFFNMGVIFEQVADYSKAFAHFDSAYTRFSGIGSPYAENARNARLRVMIKQDPFVIGHLYLQNEKPAEALAAYRAVLQSKPDSLQGYLFIAKVFSQTGPPDSVVTNYRRALAKNPNYAEALNNLARHFAERNENLEEALSLSQRSLQLEPQEPNYWDTLAEVYFRMGRFSEAKTANDNARQYAQDENARKSIAERAQKIAVKLQEQKKR